VSESSLLWPYTWRCQCVSERYGPRDKAHSKVWTQC